MYRAVIFDLDGTLIDTERFNLVAWQRASQHYGYEMSHEFYCSLVGLSKIESDRRIAARFGDGCSVTDLREKRRELFYDAWDSGTGRPDWKPGLQAVLEWLEDHGVKRAVATSSSRPEAEAKLSRSGLDFPVVVCGDEVARGKPAPDVFVEAARRLGVACQDCLAVEDSPWGVQAARDAGMQVVFVPDLLPADERVHEVALAVLPSLEALPPWLATRG